MINNKFRASYSILSMWKSGNWEMATKAYFKLEKFITPAMDDGRKWHKKWEEHINLTKTLPVEFGGGKLTDPKTEGKKVVELESWLDLVGVVDCYDKPIIYEFKSGKSSSEVYAGSEQVGVYGVLATMSGLLAERAEIYHYDQYNKRSDMSIVWLTDELLKKSHEWIVTLSSEMHAYFTDNQLYEKFGANLLKKD